MALTLSNQSTASANAAPKDKTIGTRFPADLVSLLDAVTARRGDTDRAATIRYAVVRLIEEHFPGSTKEAA